MSLEQVRDQKLRAAKEQIGRYDDLRLSFWAFNNYRTCPQRYGLQVVKEPVRPKADAFWSINGSVVHNVWQDFIGQVRTSRLDWSDRDFLQDSVQGYYDRYVAEEYVDWSKHGVDPVAHRQAAVPAARESITWLEMQLRLEGLIPCDPARIHSELTFRTQLTPTITLTGRTDLVFEHDVSITIVDLKDVKDRSKVDWRQLLWYVFGLEPVFRKRADRAGFLLTKVKDWSWRKPDAKNYRSILRDEILQVAQSIRQDPFRPIVDRHHCGFCDVQKLCPEWQSYSARSSVLLETIATLEEGRVDI